MDAVACVLGVGQGHAGHAVVAVTQDLDPQAVVLLKISELRSSRSKKLESCPHSE